MTTPDQSLKSLIAILQLAYSGELAAAYAYCGHWKSVSAADEREAIRAIEEDEWRHRKLVGEMLTSLGAAPNTTRELRATIIGRTLGVLCHVTGWLLPMYGAGKLESRNVIEYESAARFAYESAARFAHECGRTDLIDCLLEMAEVEWEHEKYFRACVLKHWLGRRVPIWPVPPAKESIRLAFKNDRLPQSSGAKPPRETIVSVS